MFDRPIVGMIKHIEGLDALVNLEELWLGKNKIAKLEVNHLFATERIENTNSFSESEHIEEAEDSLHSIKSHSQARRDRRTREFGRAIP